MKDDRLWPSQQPTAPTTPTEGGAEPSAVPPSLPGKEIRPASNKRRLVGIAVTGGVLLVLAVVGAQIGQQYIITKAVGVGSSPAPLPSEGPTPPLAAHISYRDATNQDTKYATNSTGGWLTEIVDAPGDVGEHTSIAIDGSGFIHVSYFDVGNKDLKYATNTSGQWQAETVDSTGDVGLGTSLALDSSGKAHISYHLAAATKQIKYATNKNGAWELVKVAESATADTYSSIAVDSSATPHISFRDTKRGLNYALRQPNGSWQIANVDRTKEAGIRSSIDLDSSGKPHIAYSASVNRNRPNTVRYAKPIQAGRWAIEIVATGELSEFVALDLDSESFAHIGFHNKQQEDLMYATNRLGGFRQAVVDANGTVGEYLDIAVDPFHKAYFSYFDRGNKDLKFATNTAGAFQAEVVDAAGDVGTFTSIALFEAAADEPCDPYAEPDAYDGDPCGDEDPYEDDPYEDDPYGGE